MALFDDFIFKLQYDLTNRRDSWLLGHIFFHVQCTLSDENAHRCLLKAREPVEKEEALMRRDSGIMQGVRSGIRDRGKGRTDGRIGPKT